MKTEVNGVVWVISSFYFKDENKGPSWTNSLYIYIYDVWKKYNKFYNFNITTLTFISVKLKKLKLM